MVTGIHVAAETSGLSLSAGWREQENEGADGDGRQDGVLGITSPNRPAS